MTRPGRRGPASGRAAARLRHGALVVGLVLAGCGVEAQQSPEPVPADRLPSAAASRQGTTASAAVRVWGSRESRLVPVFVELSGRRTGVSARVAALLALPEPGQRLPTVIRRGTRLTRVERSGNDVVLTFTDELRQVDVADLPLALGQIVFTVTEQPGVTRVDVLAGDEPVPYVDAAGRTIRRPLVREDFAGLAQQEAQN